MMVVNKVIFESRQFKLTEEQKFHLQELFLLHIECQSNMNVDLLVRKNLYKIYKRLVTKVSIQGKPIRLDLGAEEMTALYRFLSQIPGHLHNLHELGLQNLLNDLNQIHVNQQF